MAEMGDLIWTPPTAWRETSNVAAFMTWLAEHDGRVFETYQDLWQWSVDDVAAFWEAVWRFFDVRSTAPYASVLSQEAMPGAEWFVGARVNYIEHLLRPGRDDAIAIHAHGEARAPEVWTWKSLRDAVHGVATRLRAMGIGPGDRVAAYLPNVPEAAIAFMATASIGAIWSSCSPDFGADSVIDRFGQIAPKLLFVIDSYTYGGKTFDRLAEVGTMIEALPSLQSVVHVPGPNAVAPGGAVAFSDLLAGEPPADFAYADTAFGDPIWIVYSSGTTGLPKPFVHGHGGILLEALKFTHFHMNLKPDSCLFYFTTTGWVMWNILLSGLISGGSVVLYDGHPMHPDPDRLWALAAETGMTFFGASPAFISQQMKLGIEPARAHDLGRLDSVLLGGSPVMPEHMVWLQQHVNPDLWITSQSGGTDVATGFVGASPLLPVHAGEIQTRCLGVDVHALDDDGHPRIDQVGELVVRKPMPSMPLYFWNDPDGRRYHESYFDVYPGLWRHGDYLKVNDRGGCYILGRSDSTLNRFGVRIGTAEIYRCLDTLEDVQDSLIVNLDLPDGGSFMPLFVAMKDGRPCDDAARERIRQALRKAYSPRHVPDEIVEVSAIPYTLTGKKLEVPVRKILMGVAPDKAASKDAMANPAALDFFVDYARRRAEASLFA